MQRGWVETGEADHPGKHEAAQGDSPPCQTVPFKQVQPGWTSAGQGTTLGAGRVTEANV